MEIIGAQILKPSVQVAPLRSAPVKSTPSIKAEVKMASLKLAFEN
jgi:hypothetical protein